MSFSFKLTDIQLRASGILAGVAKYVLLRGGTRSGKTFIIVVCIVARALMAPGSRHAILGFRFNRIKQAIVLDTFPNVLKTVFPGCGGRLDKVDYYYEFPNGSQVWFGGLDDAERTEKVLGKEFASILLNESSQISNDSRQTVETRLAQKVLIEIPTPLKDGKPDPDCPPNPLNGTELRLKMYYDCNPPKKSHWVYKLFIRKVDPEDGKPLPNPEEFAELKMNPADNQENLGAGYLQSLNNMSASKRRRFRDGEFGEDNPNQLFDEDNFEKHRVIDLDEVPDMVRIVVAIDPSGADDKDNEDNDAIGIVAAGIGTDGNAYILSDETVKAGPGTWGRVACNLYDSLEADCVVGEQNYGGAMVKFVIRTANPRVPYRKVTATRGKVVRAEPVSALYAQGKVRHVGMLRELEDELVGFTTYGYEGDKSPNRADAAIWAVYALFPALTRKKEEPDNYEPGEPADPGCSY